MSKPRIEEVIVVEGRYDRNMFYRWWTPPLWRTGGFSVFNDGEKLAFLRNWPKAGPDPAGRFRWAGFVIRNYLKGLFQRSR